MEITNSLNHLIEYDKDEGIRSARIISALTTLNALAGQSANKDQLLRDVTSILTAATAEDIDFSKVGQVRFDVLCLRNWAPYEVNLRDNPVERGYILYRYLSALHELRGRHESYISKVNWDREASKYTHPMKLILEPENDFLLSQRLAEGIRAHWLLIDDESRRGALVQDFQAATGNPQLTFQLLRGARSS